jgi:hypothetical protein
MTLNGNGHTNGSTAPRAEPSARDLAIFEKRLAGASVHAIAKEMHLPVKEVDAALTRACCPLDEGYRLTTIGLELARFDQLVKVFYAKACNGDASAANVLIKVSERRAAILGLDVPAASRQDPVVLQTGQTPQPTTTERIRAALDRIAGRRTAEPDDPD